MFKSASKQLLVAGNAQQKTYALGCFHTLTAAAATRITVSAYVVPKHSTLEIFEIGEAPISRYLTRDRSTGCT